MANSGSANNGGINSFLKEHQNDDILLVFSASWVSQSTIVDIVTEKIKFALPNLIVKDIDIEENQKLITRFYISKLPSAVLIKKGKLIGKKIGTFSKKDIIDIYQAN